MSASAETSSKYPSSRIVGLKPFKSGDQWRGHKGGKKGGNRVDVEYQRLLDMSADEAATFQPANGAQIIAYKQFLEACSNKRNSLDYAKEITDRTSGKVADRLEVTNGHTPEVKQAITIRAYFLLFMAIEREEAIAAVDECFRLKAAGEYDAMLAAVEAAVVKDSEVVQPYLVEAERVVTGG